MNPDLMKMLAEMTTNDSDPSASTDASPSGSQSGAGGAEESKLKTSKSPARKKENARKEPYTTSVVKDGRRKFHTTFPNNEEMVEEYDLKTNKLVVRKVRQQTVLGREGTWTYEIGGDAALGAKPFNPMNDLLAPSSANPVVIRNDTEHEFQWRVRNCFYDKSVYRVSVDEKAQEIVIRTTNKKFYKRIQVPGMKRWKLPLEQADLDWTFTNNTLIITYEKPEEIRQHQDQMRRELEMMKTQKAPREGDVQCPQQ